VSLCPTMLLRGQIVRRVFGSSVEPYREQVRWP
jgi:hypothetical protein